MFTNCQVVHCRDKSNKGSRYIRYYKVIGLSSLQRIIKATHKQFQDYNKVNVVLSEGYLHCSFLNKETTSTIMLNQRRQKKNCWNFLIPTIFVKSSRIFSTMYLLCDIILLCNIVMKFRHFLLRTNGRSNQVTLHFNSNVYHIL